ncbi:FAD-dependent oxidoreductase [Agrococcus terreus]|uniref:FAD/NAD(P)-binding domain-containing protein n=1 Tax=Agrococcus terreus TaxID=574649 RepID=A0ABQ2KD30_9MICO|nr:FAD-dependent oxidoreductase [Agrococcus terreus]GGN78122.1 hypothetical protein GCM10010968_03550 [Agrococcus terreus]
MASEQDGIVIVGAGAAGHAAAAGLRRHGWTGRIRLVHGEDGPPINRTLVDTGLLPGLLTVGQIALPPLDDVELVHARAIALDPESRSVALSNGQVLTGEAIVLATGSAPRALDPSVEVDAEVPLHVLHTADDAASLRGAVAALDAPRIAVLGAGFIGAEVASLWAPGARVTLVGRSALPLRDAVGEGIAARLAALHAERVDARLGSRVLAVRATPGGAAPVRVELAGEDGASDVVDADLVVVAVGAAPAAAWAGFPGAVPTDDRLRVPGMPGVYAAGGAAAPEVDGAPLRVDHWDAAAAQGAHAAQAVLHDLGLAADPGPWRPITGFTLMAHGAVVSGRGAWAPGAETTTEAAGDGLLALVRDASGTLVGVAGWNAGRAVAEAAARIGAAAAPVASGKPA